MARQAPAGPDEGLLIAQAYEAAFLIDGHDASCCYSDIMLLCSNASYWCPGVLWARPPFFEAPTKRDHSA
jgi:hypothetical protein